MSCNIICDQFILFSLKTFLHVVTLCLLLEYRIMNINISYKSIFFVNYKNCLTLRKPLLVPKMLCKYWIKLMRNLTDTLSESVYKELQKNRSLIYASNKKNLFNRASRAERILLLACVKKEKNKMLTHFKSFT
jgi:hypothetical protein